MEKKHKGGRPPLIGRDLVIRFTPDLIDAVDNWRGEMSRSAAVRHLVEAGLRRPGRPEHLKADECRKGGQ